MIRALVIDDDKDFLNIVSKVLENAGYAVSTSENAHDGFEKIQQERFDIVLSDANMPGASGFDLVKTLKGDSKFSGIAIALLTGRREKKDVYYGLQCGADDYIVKPIDLDLFLSKVQSLLSKRPKEDLHEIGFAQSKINFLAKLEVTLKIVKLSEQGLTLWGPMCLGRNHKIQIGSELFSSIGIQPPKLRVLDSTGDPKNDHFYFIQVAFIGLNESELQKIRYWVNVQIANHEVRVA